MEKEFIPYEQALALKELGFDEPCMVYYGLGIEKENTTQLQFHINKRTTDYHIETDESGFFPIEKRNSDYGYVPMAPTFSQVFRWFREKYNLHSYIIDSKSYKWYFNIDDMTIDDVISEVLYFKTYEEAELECLKKLIEIVNG